MRKKSHISLARYIVRSMEENQFVQHRKAFYLGSILPDCKPSFLSTKHEFEGTFPMVKESINRLIENQGLYGTNQRAFMRHLGEVIHYLADYFTFPHNAIYPGSLKDHCVYEGELKIALREYIWSGRAASEQKEFLSFDSASQLFDFIQKTHEEYLRIKHTIEEDCRYIVRLCHQVAVAVIELFGVKYHERLSLENLCTARLAGGTV